MKTKSLMTMLLGGAMLAACTADDALNSAPVAQEVNPSAPVFNVTFEDDDLQNRGELDGKYNMVWGNGDLMSLFHGVQDVSNQAFGNWQNAIYEAEGGDEGKLTFLTNAMVQLGYAMMVYPADLTHDQTPTGVGTDYPIISLPDVQDAETKGNTPYISEILHLTKDGADGTGVAGYRQEYDIVMRRAATTLTVNLKALKPALQIAGVEDFEIKSVELIAGGGKTPFTQSIKVKPSEDPRKVNNEVQTYWAYNTVMEINEPTDRIITTDVKDNSVVTFTLLKGTAADLQDCSMVLHTNYGDITVDESDKGQWVGSTNKTTTEALEYVYENTFAVAEDGTFKDEEKGRAIALTVGVDMQDIKLNGMHIADEAALNTALLVYENITTTEKPILILDGQGDNHEFLIEDAELLKKVVNYMNDEKELVKFQACTKDDKENCLAVKLVGGAAADAAVEVPNLVFDKTAGLQASQVDVQVELTGYWKYNSEVDKAKTLTGVSELMVLGSLDLQSNFIKADGCTKIVVAKGGYVDVTNNVIMGLSLYNHGIVQIENQQTLSVEGTAKIINWWSVKNDDDADDMVLTGWNQTDDETDGRCGVIKVKGTLGASKVANGSSVEATINNYGVIVLENAFAAAMISSNQTEGANTKNAYDPATETNGVVTGGNVFGVIKLYDKIGGGSGLTKIADDDKGFVKLEVGITSAGKDEDVTYANIGDLANYIVATGKTISTTKDKFLGKTADNIDYIELRGSYVTFGGSADKPTSTFNLKGLIVPAGHYGEFPEGTTVTVSESVFLKGNLRGDGEATIPQYTGYFGGDATDYVHAVVGAAGSN